MAEGEGEEGGSGKREGEERVRGERRKKRKGEET